jgi:hypothetical protein
MDTCGWGRLGFSECEADFECSGVINFFEIQAFLNPIGDCT